MLTINRPGNITSVCYCSTP